jgi:hypothetical protein
MDIDFLIKAGDEPLREAGALPAREFQSPGGRVLGLRRTAAAAQRTLRISRGRHDPRLERDASRASAGWLTTRNHLRAAALRIVL